jgi:hypothetical protein
MIEGRKAISSVSFKRSIAHMPRVTLRTIDPAKVLACHGRETPPPEGFARHVHHLVQGHVHDAGEGEVARHQHQHAEADHRAEGVDRLAQRAAAIGVPWTAGASASISRPT